MPPKENEKPTENSSEEPKPENSDNTENESENENAGSDVSGIDGDSIGKLYNLVSALTETVGTLTDKISAIQSTQNEIVKTSRIIDDGDDYSDIKNEDGLDDIKHLKDLDLVIND